MRVGSEIKEVGGVGQGEVRRRRGRCVQSRRDSACLPVTADQGQKPRSWHLTSDAAELLKHFNRQPEGFELFYSIGGFPG